MKQFLLWIVVFMVAFSAKAQLKPEAMTLPITFTGIPSAEERAILDSHVINELSAYYDLKSEKEVEQAREVAVDKISSENCTEETCVKKMGELLDVDHTFTLKIIAAGNYWDLSAIRLDLMGTTVRRNLACEQCTLSRARLLLTELIVGLRPGTTIVKRGEAVLQLESEPRSMVFLEGIEQGITPLVLTVPTDRPAEILAVAEGYQDYSNLFELKSGELRKIKIPLVRRRGSVEITSEPSGASIILDGKQLTSSEGHPMHTPSTIRPVYGEHNLMLKLEKHQNLETEIKINRPNFGTKNYILKPNPGRLIVRVPSEFKDADLIINGREISEMGGKIAKGFEVDANVSLKVQAKQGDFESNLKSVEVGPEETKKVEFSEFSDLRLIALSKKQEEKERKRQEEIIRKRKEREEQRRRQKAEQRRKKQAENFSCGWLHYAAVGLTVAGAAASMNGAFLISTAVSSTTSGFMFCDWWGAMFALQQEQIIYVAYNHSSIMEEATQGSGPHVEALATLHGCPMKAQIEFSSMLQQTFTDKTEVFFDYNQSPAHSREFLGLLRQGIQQHPVLSQECRPRR